jgi:glycerate 2-kinase
MHPAVLRHPSKDLVNGTLALVHVLVAPDKFAGTLTAAEAAAAIADGWRRASPADTVELMPLADGGPGFLEVISAAVPGHTRSALVTGPLGESVHGRVHAAGKTAYIEAADACGLHLIPSELHDPEVTTSYGVGELVAAAVDAEASRLVVGLGGSATNDAGSGLLAALGALPADALRRGGGTLSLLERIDVEPARHRVNGVELVIASDVENVLYGPHGASVTFGPQKGASSEQVERLDAALRHFARLADWRPANQPGAGAAGGIGYALLLLGGQRVSGAQLVLDAVGALDRARRADLVLTGEGSLDWQSLRGKVVTGVARVAQEAARPCVVIAGQVRVGRRELSALGVDAAYSAADVAGSAEAALVSPAASLAAAAERVARTWSRRP